MDSIKAQDIIRHIFKDEDKGVAYVTGLSITDGVEVLTKVLPELIKKAQEKNNVNDEGYFNEIGNVYRKIVVDKLLNADHLWTIYCDSTGYPYMVDDDIVVLFDTKNGTQEVENYLSNVIEPNFLYFKDEFENHFGCWKNKLKNLCKGDYIFFIDADEIPNLDFFLKLPNILKEYPNNDLFYIPRINTVKD